MGGGLNLDGWNTRRTPPPWTLSAWRHQFEKRPHSWTFTSTPPPPWTLSAWRHQFEKTPPLLDIHKHPPPLDIARVTSSTYSKGGTKLLKGGTKLLKGGTKLLKGGTKLLKGGTKLLKGGTKLLKGGTKLLKGGTKSLGWATGGGRTTPPTPPPPPPPGYGPATYIHRYVNTLLSVSVILLHFPCTSEAANTHAHFLCVLVPSFHTHPSQCPPTKRPHPHRFSQQSEPFGVSARGLSQPKFGQQRRLTSLWLPWAIFGLLRCSPKDPWTLDIGKVNSPQSTNLHVYLQLQMCWDRGKGTTVRY